MNKSVPKSGPNRNLVDMFPEDWDYYRLGDLKQDSRYGLNESAVNRESEEQPRYIRVTDIKEVGLGDEQKTVDCEVQEKDELKNGDLLFARSGTIGKVYIHIDGDNYTHGGYTIKYRIDSDIVNPKLIYHYTQSKMVQDWFDRVSRGSTQSNISTSELDDLVIPVPPVDEQERIVSLLSDVDEYIEKTSERVHALEQAKQAILQQMFKNNFEDIDIINIVNLDPDSFNSEDFNQKSVPYISLSCVSEGHLVDMEEIDIDDPPSRARHIVREGDILVGKVRPKQQSHYKVTSEEDGAVASSGFVVFRPTGDIVSNYLIQSVLSRDFYEQMHSRANGLDYPSVTKSDIKTMTLPTPDIETQKIWASILTDIDQYVRKTREDAKSMRELKKGLLQELFSG